MRKLDDNDERYAEFFWWKDFYEVKMGPEERSKAFCDICNRLYEENGQQKTYDDLEEWWTRKAKCISLRY